MSESGSWGSRRLPWDCRPRAGGSFGHRPVYCSFLAPCVAAAHVVALELPTSHCHCLHRAKIQPGIKAAPSLAPGFRPLNMVRSPFPSSSTAPLHPMFSRPAPASASAPAAKPAPPAKGGTGCSIRWWSLSLPPLCSPMGRLPAARFTHALSPPSPASRSCGPPAGTAPSEAHHSPAGSGRPPLEAGTAAGPQCGAGSDSGAAVCPEEHHPGHRWWPSQ